MDKKFKFISFPSPVIDRSDWDRLEGRDLELYRAFYNCPVWHSYLRERHYDDYANESFESDGRYRAQRGMYVTKPEYVSDYLEYELNNAGDQMEYVFNFTRNPELAVKCMRFDKQNQVPSILRRMENMSYNQKCVYVERIIAKGKRVAQEGGYGQVFKAAARQ